MRQLFEKADLAKWAMELGLRKTVHAEVTDAELERWAALTQDTPEHKNLRKMARKELTRRAAGSEKEQRKAAGCPQGTRWMEGECRAVAHAEEAPMRTMQQIFEDEARLERGIDRFVEALDEETLEALAKGMVTIEAVIQQRGSAAQYSKMGTGVLQQLARRGDRMAAQTLQYRKRGDAKKKVKVGKHMAKRMARYKASQAAKKKGPSGQSVTAFFHKQGD